MELKNVNGVKYEDLMELDKSTLANWVLDLLREKAAAQPVKLLAVCGCLNQTWDPSCIGLRCQVCNTPIHNYK
jgi:hypothetical protein